MWCRLCHFTLAVCVSFLLVLVDPPLISKCLVSPCVHFLSCGFWQIWSFLLVCETSDLCVHADLLINRKSHFSNFKLTCFLYTHLYMPVMICVHIYWSRDLNYQKHLWGLKYFAFWICSSPLRISCLWIIISLLLCYSSLYATGHLTLQIEF